MTDEKSASRTEEELATEAAEAERKLGQNLSFGIPAASIVAAIGVGVVTSAGPAILVLLGGALLGAIAFLWASLRTLGGDAPLAEEMELLHVRTAGGADLAARKQKALRALKDLKHEHDIGKIDDADYKALEAKYRDEAKDVLRKLDTEIEPYRAKAEALAEKHLAKAGLTRKEKRAKTDEADEGVDADADEAAKKSRKKAGAAKDATKDDAKDDAKDATKDAAEDQRKPCPKCDTPNDPDAAFCKKCGTSLASEAAAGEAARDAR